MASRTVVVAEIVRPRGNRGEVLARSQTDVPGRLETSEAGASALADGSDIQVEIEEAWEHKGDWVLRFAGVDSIDAAERFAAPIFGCLRGTRRVAGRRFFSVGSDRLQGGRSRTGKVLGVVEGWQQYGGPPLMELTVERPRSADSVRAGDCAGGSGEPSRFESICPTGSVGAVNANATSTL